MDFIISLLPILGLLSVWGASSFYFAKKIESHRKNIVTDTARPASSLTLVRGVEPTNYLRKYKIFIDDREAGYMESGETKHFQLLPGEHSIKFQIDWCVTPQINFNISINSNTEIQCGANYNNWKCIFMSFVRPSDWLYVKVV